MAFIKVDLGKINHVISELDGQITFIESKNKEIINKLESLPQSWEGTDGTKFTNASIKQMKSDKMKTILKGLKNTKKRLADNKNAYERAQAEAINRARRL